MCTWIKEELTFKRLSLRLEDANVLTASAVSILSNHDSMIASNKLDDKADRTHNIRSAFPREQTPTFLIVSAVYTVFFKIYPRKLKILL